MTSFDDREWTRHADANTIYFGIRSLEFNKYYLLEPSAERSDHIQRIEKRAQIFGNLYRPLIWIDERVSKIRIELPLDKNDTI